MLHGFGSTSVVRRVMVGAALLACTCKKDEPQPTTDTAPVADSAGEAAPSEAGGEKPGVGEVVGEAVGGGATPAGEALDTIARQGTLGHLLLPNPAKFIDELRNKAAPPQAAMFLNEAMLRNMVSGQLGARKGLAEHVDLGKPFGCVVVDSKATELPVACTFGYQGGVDALITDLGTEGKLPDAQGHKAAYTISGQELFVDPLGDQLVVSTHPTLFETVKPYVEANLIGRAKTVRDDVELIGFVAAALTRYEEEVRPFMDAMRNAATAPQIPSEGLGKYLAEYNAASGTAAVDFYQSIEQFHVGVGIEDVGVVVRYAMRPVEGSPWQAELAAQSGAEPLGADALDRLPAESVLAVSSTFEFTKFLEGSSYAALRKALVKAYAENTSKDPMVVDAAITAFLAAQRTTYTPKTSYAVFQPPGGVGAVVLTRQLAAGSGREAWKAWTTVFDAPTILGPEGVKYVTWSFAPEAQTVDELPVDRWTIELTEAAKAELRKEMGAAYAEWEPKLGGYKLQIDRLEIDSAAMYVVSPAGSDAATKRALAAHKGTEALAGAPGLATVLDHSKGSSMVVAANVKQGIGWLRTILPAEETAKMPPIGSDISDVFGNGTYDPKGGFYIEVIATQPFVDQLRNLGGGS